MDYSCLDCCVLCYNPSMNTITAIKVLNGISSYQRGLFTTAQAHRIGVERYALSRLEKEGLIERLAKGVYRMGGAPSLREEEVLATWLSLNPTREPGARIKPANEPVATGVTAAWLQHLGEVGPTPLEFCMTERKQTQRRGLKLRKRHLHDQDVIRIAGIPVTSPAKTILDLIDFGEDISLVSSVLHDALNRRLIENENLLSEEINSRSSKVGLPKNSSLYDWMTGTRPKK